MKDKMMQWLHRLHTKTMHGVCSGVSEAPNEVAGRIRFLAKFRQPKIIALVLASLMLVGVGVFCLGGDASTAQNDGLGAQGDGIGSGTQGGKDALLSLDEIAAISEELYSDFTLSIVQQGGAVTYRFDVADATVAARIAEKTDTALGDFYLLVNAEQTNLTLCSGETSIEIPCATVFGNATDSPAILALQDLTDDGVEEFVYLHADGGTGTLGTTAHIINIATMKEYALPDVVTGLAQQVEVLVTGNGVTGEDERYLQCEVKYHPNGWAREESFGSMVQPFAAQLSEEQMNDRRNFVYVPEEQPGNWVALELTTEGLQATVGLQLTNQIPWEYVAEATGMLVYDAITDVFVVGKIQSATDSMLAWPSDELIAQAEQDALNAENEASGKVAQTREEYIIWQADLLHDGDGALESVMWDDIAFDDTQNQPLYVQVAGETELPRDAALWQTEDAQSPSVSHVGNIAYSLYSDETGDYMLRYTEQWYSGSCEANFDLFYLSERGEEIVVDSGKVNILGPDMPYDGAQNDIDAVSAFVQTVAEYSRKSYVLVSTIFDVGYYDVHAAQVLEYQNFVRSDAENPIQLIPYMMQDYMTAQSVEEQEAAIENLHAQLIQMNERRADIYAEIQAKVQAINDAAFAETGMVAPFRAEKTYAASVEKSYDSDPEGWRENGIALATSEANGTIVTDPKGNEVVYSLTSASNTGGAIGIERQSGLIMNEVYWNGYTYGDLPEATDKIYYDFYYYEDFRSILSCAQVIPQGANLKFTVDSSAAGNHKKISMIACNYFAADGTELLFDSVFYADKGVDDCLTIEIPSLDYYGEEEMVLKFTLCFRDETTEQPEDRLVVSLPCKQG